MPKVPIDYSKTCIYKLVHFDDLNDDNIYVGYCTNIVKRRDKHKRRCCNPESDGHNLKVYQFIRANGGWDQWQMILVEKYPCDIVDEAIARERYWKRELNATLNTQEPGRTRKEYREENKEKMAEYQKQYNEINKEYLKEQKKEYRENNKEEINQRNKKYREKNPNKNKEYYENNKHKNAEKVTCECGSIIRSIEISRHRKSKKHQEWVKNNNLTIN